MDKLTNKELMAKIVAVVGREGAIRLVNDAYNAEILTNRIGRIEDSSTKKIGLPEQKDLLRLALKRVLSVCELAG